MNRKMKRLCATLLLLGTLCCAHAAEKSPTIVYINGSKYYIHTVQAGETLYSLAREYGVGEQVIVENNPSVAQGLKADARLKIPFMAEAPEAKPSERKLKKTFDMHYVRKGETLYAISRRYAISIQTILEDNPNLDPTHLRPDEQILIRRKESGKGSEAQRQAEWEAYRTALNSVAEKGYAYHIVRPGETFYSLSRRFGTTEEELSRLNNGLQPADLKAGAMLKIPSDEPAAPAPAVDSLSVAHPDSAAARQLPEVTFRALRRSEPLDIALMLPISVKGRANSNYLEFYQGFLLGLEQVKQRYGYSVELTFYNTGRDSAAIDRIVSSPDFARNRLIVGPVYEDELYPVVRYAEEHDVPVVTPLANIEALHSDALFQMAADPALKYDKVAELLNGNRRVTLIYAGSTDKEFEQEVLALLGDRPFTRYNYRYEHPSVRRANSPSDLTPLLQNKEENVFVIMAENEVDVDRILAAIASADTSITSRGLTAPSFVVLGNARWHRFGNIDRTMFFKDRLVFVSTYHAKRDAEVIASFDSDYIRAFGALPTLYSYRGYDAAMIFCPTMYGDIENDLENTTYTPLQTTYRFQREEGGSHVNRNWTRVNYNSDYTITIE